MHIYVYTVYMHTYIHTVHTYMYVRVHVLPASESLATAGVNALREAVMETRVDHTHAEGLLCHLTAGIPADTQTHTIL